MRKWLYVGFFLSFVAIGYFLRGAIGREVFIWITLGSLGLVIFLKLVQIGLMHLVKVQEARMSPDERREFEEYKKQHAVGDETK
jgi:hypothetical protein